MWPAQSNVPAATTTATMAMTMAEEPDTNDPPTMENVAQSEIKV